MLNAGVFVDSQLTRFFPPQPLPFLRLLEYLRASRRIRGRQGLVARLQSMESKISILIVSNTYKPNDNTQLYKRINYNKYLNCGNVY